MVYSVIPERAASSDVQFDAGVQKVSFLSESHCTGVRQVKNVLLLDHETRVYLNFGPRLSSLEIRAISSRNLLSIPKLHRTISCSRLMHRLANLRI